MDNDYKLLVLELRKLLKRSKVLEQHTKIILDKIKQLKEFENLNKYLVKKESKEKKKVEFNEIVEDAALFKKLRKDPDFKDLSAKEIWNLVRQEQEEKSSSSPSMSVSSSPSSYPSPPSTTSGKGRRRKR